MSVRVEVRPRVLTWARARSGIAEEDWGRRFPRFEAWLAGGAAPTLKQLEEFARKTHTPVGFLFLDKPPVEPVPIPDFRTVGDRPIGGTGGGEVVSADLLDVVYTCQARQEWYRDHQLLNGEPPLAFVGAASTATPAAEAAAGMREVLGWDAENRAQCRTWEAALIRLRESAEAAGVLVMISGVVGSDTHRKLDPEDFRGFALADTYAALVFVNGADSKAAQVFTLAHELAHLWLGATALSDLEPTSIRGNTVERWCNQVAAELLVPMDELRALLDATADSPEPAPVARKALPGQHPGDTWPISRSRSPDLGPVPARTRPRTSPDRRDRRRAGERRRRLLQHQGRPGRQAVRPGSRC